MGEIDLEGKKALEVGVGNAELSVKMAHEGAQVTAVDINPEAVEHTKERFEKRDAEPDIFKSDLFAEVQGKYDHIIFNPPYLKGEEGIGDEEMWRGGETGLEVAKRFLEQVSDYLTENGKAWVVLSSQTEYNKLVKQFNLNEVDSEKLWFERLYLMEFK